MSEAIAGGTAAERPRYASFARRTMAALIDFSLAYLISLLFLVPTALIAKLVTHLADVQESPQQATLQVLPFLIGIVVQWLYFALSESSRWQATLGKRILRVRVTDLNGRRINFARASIRYFAKYLSAIPAGIGFIKVLLVDNRQAFHDSVAGTLVVRG